MLSIRQCHYIDKTIKNENVRKCITSKNEYQFKEILDELKLIEDKDYYHQFCFHNNDLVIVVDFFFPKVGVIFEIDGKDHLEKHKRNKDKIRDSLCRAQGFHIFRIKSPIPKNKLSFWFSFMRELTKEKESID